MDLLFSFPVGLFHPLQYAGFGALRFADAPPCDEPIQGL